MFGYLEFRTGGLASHAVYRVMHVADGLSLLLELLSLGQMRDLSATGPCVLADRSRLTTAMLEQP